MDRWHTNHKDHFLHFLGGVGGFGQITKNRNYQQNNKQDVSREVKQLSHCPKEINQTNKKPICGCNFGIYYLC